MLATSVLTLASAVYAAGDYDARARSGVAALNEGDLTRAEIELRKAVELNPDNADTHAALALVLAQGHQRAEALGEYKKALRLDRRYVEGRKVRLAVSERGWLKGAAETWDLEQQDIAMEVFNEPKPHQKERLAFKIHFPPNWVLDGSSARPNDSVTHASITATGGRNAFNAFDADMWFELARGAQAERYLDLKIINKKLFQQKGASGMRVEYTRKAPRYRERFHVIEIILVKEGQYRRAAYEAPESEFSEHARVAEASLGTLEFE